MITPILSAKKITKTFSAPSSVSILKGIDLDLFPQEAIAILGKSGEGKSTLLHILGTLDTPTSGTLEINGKLTSEQELALLRNAHIGFVFQQAHLLEEETLLENVLMPAKIGKHPTSPSSPLYKRAISLIEQVGLSHRLLSSCKLLSGGEKQRAAIARALLLNPPILFADEPSGNLDSVHSKIIQDLLLFFVKQEKKSMIVATHDASFASRCDRILCLKDGILSPLTITVG